MRIMAQAAALVAGEALLLVEVVKVEAAAGADRGDVHNPLIHLQISRIRASVTSGHALAISRD